MSQHKSSTRELYEQLAASPQRRRTIAENIFRQLRSASPGGSGGFSPDTGSAYRTMLRTRTAE